MKAKFSNHVDIDEWWKLSERSEACTFFQTPVWHQLISEVFEEYDSLPVSFSLDNNILGVIPFIKLNSSIKGVFSNRISTFGGNYGGILANKKLDEKTILKIYSELSAWNTGTIIVRNSPLIPEISESEDDRYIKVKKYTTHLLDLTPSLDQLVEKFSGGHSNGINKAKKSGLKVRKANSLEDYKEYFKIYKERINQWGPSVTTEYPWDLFEIGNNYSAMYPNLMKLWLVEYNDKIIAGAWVFYWNRHAVGWHSASLSDYLHLRPNNFLQFEIIKDAKERGFQLFDFNPSSGFKGVEKFKEGFGAQKIDLYEISIEGKLYHWTKKCRDYLSGSKKVQ